MNMIKRYLLDVNLMIALGDLHHASHRISRRWIENIGTARIVLCPITESGFVRLLSSPHVGRLSMAEALDKLRAIKALPHCECVSLDDSFLELIRPIENQMMGYKQVTDALLLGIAIRHNLILATLDLHLHSLAGSRYQANLVQVK